MFFFFFLFTLVGIKLSAITQFFFDDACLCDIWIKGETENGFATIQMKFILDSIIYI